MYCVFHQTICIATTDKDRHLLQIQQMIKKTRNIP